MFSTVSKQLRSHPALIPLLVFIGGGCTMSLTYLARLALRNPDVCWDKTNNPEPWNKLGPNYQYKCLMVVLVPCGIVSWFNPLVSIAFFSVNTDYAKLEKNRPDF